MMSSDFSTSDMMFVFFLGFATLVFGILFMIYTRLKNMPRKVDNKSEVKKE